MPQSRWGFLLRWARPWWFAVRGLRRPRGSRSERVRDRSLAWHFFARLPPKVERRLIERGARCCEIVIDFGPGAGVPEAPGLGVTLDREALERLKAATPAPIPKALVRIQRQGGPTSYARPFIRA